jgi:hypothetical protein
MRQSEKRVKLALNQEKKKILITYFSRWNGWVGGFPSFLPSFLPSQKTTNDDIYCWWERCLLSPCRVAVARLFLFGIPLLLWETNDRQLKATYRMESCAFYLTIYLSIYLSIYLYGCCGLLFTGLFCLAMMAISLHVWIWNPSWKHTHLNGHGL